MLSIWRSTRNVAGADTSRKLPSLMPVGVIPPVRTCKWCSNALVGPEAPSPVNEVRCGGALGTQTIELDGRSNVLTIAGVRRPGGGPDACELVWRHVVDLSVHKQLMDMQQPCSFSA